jgi:aspartate-semialdehyde dehydrogenase
MKIVLIGATGLVGQCMLELIDKENIAFEELFLVASVKSKGKKIRFQEKDYAVMEIQEALEQKPDIALFSAGSSISKQWAPLFAEKGCFVIDNSSAWRSYDHIPLVVFGVNESIIQQSEHIIANPNCSTIQLALVLDVLHKEFGLERVIVSTYQSVSGSGMAGIEQLRKEQNGEKSNAAYPHPIHENCLPHGGDFLENAYTTEEMKLINESRKILSLSNLAITATVVRVPVTGGHSESVNICFERKIDLYRIKSLLAQKAEICLMDNPQENEYPTPLHAKGKDAVFVGRIRKDYSVENGINLWIVGDNLRIGAATNAVRIMKHLINREYIS